MAGPTMTELIAQVRRRTDTENSVFVRDGELADYINDSIADLYAELMARWGDEYFVDEENIAIPAGANDEDGNIYELVPGPFSVPPLQFLGVSLWDPVAQTLTPLRQFDRGDTVVSVAPSDWLASPPRYRFVSTDVIEFDRPPQADADVIVRAIPAPTRYAFDDSTTPIEEVFAWREYVIVDAAIKVLSKEESDTAALEARKQVLLLRISANAPPRDAASPTLVRDDRAFQGWSEDWL